MPVLRNAVRYFFFDESGPTAVEYAVMLALILMVCVVAVQLLGSDTASTFSNVGTALPSTSS